MRRFENQNLPKNFGMRVQVQNDNVDQALRKLKKKMNDDGRLQEYRERTEYEKPTIKRVKAKKQAVARNRKREAQNQLHKKRLY